MSIVDRNEYGFTVIIEVHEVQRVRSDDVQGPTFEYTLSGYRQALRQDSDRAKVEEYVVIGAEAENVIESVPPVVRPAERADVSRLRVGRDWGWKIHLAHLAGEFVEPLHLPSDRGIANNSLNRLR